LQLLQKIALFPSSWSSLKTPRVISKFNSTNAFYFIKHLASIYIVRKLKNFIFISKVTTSFTRRLLKKNLEYRAYKENKQKLLYCRNFKSFFLNYPAAYYYNTVEKNLALKIKLHLYIRYFYTRFRRTIPLSLRNLDLLFEKIIRRSSREKGQYLIKTRFIRKKVVKFYNSNTLVLKRRLESDIKKWRRRCRFFAVHKRKIRYQNRLKFNLHYFFRGKHPLKKLRLTYAPLQRARRYTMYGN